MPNIVPGWAFFGPVHLEPERIVGQRGMVVCGKDALLEHFSHSIDRTHPILPMRRFEHLRIFAS
jgi:hypothetical protein